MRTVSSITFARTLEIARAALAGAECMTLTMRGGLAMPVDRLERMTEAIAIARQELHELEHWATVETRDVH